MKIKRWIWFRTKQGAMLGYLYNPYLKSIAYCLDMFNCINGSILTRNDVKVSFED